MKLSKNGLNLIKKFEGCRLTAYKPVSSERYYTIGYGHYSPSIHKGQHISQATAEQLLKNDTETFVSAVSKAVKVSLNQNQFDALVSFTYNLGIGNLQSSTLLKLINKKDFKGAANEFPKWVHSNGKVLNGLVKRRAAEKALFIKTMPKPKKNYTSIAYDGKLYKIGSRGERVKMIQRALNIALGKTVVIVDGIFGNQTRNQVVSYQKRHKLSIDGIVGKETWKTLF